MKQSQKPPIAVPADGALFELVQDRRLSDLKFIAQQTPEGRGLSKEIAAAASEGRYDRLITVLTAAVTAGIRPMEKEDFGAAVAWAILNVPRQQEGERPGSIGGRRLDALAVIMAMDYVNRRDFEPEHRPTVADAFMRFVAAQRLPDAEAKSRGSREALERIAPAKWKEWSTRRYDIDTPSWWGGSQYMSYSREDLSQLERAFRSIKEDALADKIRDDGFGIHFDGGEIRVLSRSGRHVLELTLADMKEGKIVVSRDIFHPTDAPYDAWRNELRLAGDEELIGYKAIQRAREEEWYREAAKSRPGHESYSFLGHDVIAHTAPVMSAALFARELDRSSTPPRGIFRIADEFLPPDRR